MGCAPHLATHIKARLKQINHHFYAEWDKKRERWIVKAKIAGHRPKFVTTVQDEYKRYIPFDERTFSRLQHMIWYNRNLSEYAWELDYANKRAEEARDAAEEDYYRQVALACRRPMQMLARELGVASGKAKIPYSPGFGKGTPNVCAG